MAKTRGTSSTGRSSASTTAMNPMTRGLQNLASTSKGGSIEDIKGIFKKGADLLNNPSLARLGLNKLVPGGFGKAGAELPDIFFGSSGGSGLGADNDWRVRVTAPGGSPFDFGNGPLSALSEDKGVIFPYTPNISVSHSAMYGNLTPTHSNYPSYFYQSSQVQAISISADFTAQTADQAAYVLGMIWFFRSASKMFYGGPKAGNPPPVVYLDGYGDYYLPHVPCVVTSFTHTMPSNIDYIECTIQQGTTTTTQAIGDLLPQQLQTAGLSSSSVVGLAGAATTQTGAVLQTPKQSVIVTTTGKRARIPTKSGIQVTLQPVYSRRNIADKFTWEDFSSGGLLKGNGGFL